MTTSKTIEITREEFQQILADYGHHINVEVPVRTEHPEYNPETGELEDYVWKTVLNNAMVYNPYGKKGAYQTGMASNEDNAERAMAFVKGKAKIYSSVFNHTTGIYEIID